MRQAVRVYELKSERNESGIDYTAHFSLPRDRFNARGFGGKIYEVCTLVRNDLLGCRDVSPRIKSVEWDLKGRVLLLKLPE